MGRNEPSRRSVKLHAGSSKTFRTVSLAGLWPFVNEKGRVRSSPVRLKRGDLKVRTLPTTMIQALAPFAPLFSKSASGLMCRCFWREPYSLRARGA